MKTANKQDISLQQPSSVDENTALLKKLKQFEPAQTDSEDVVEKTPASAKTIREPAVEKQDDKAADDIYKALIKYYLTNKLPGFVSAESLPKKLYPALLFRLRDLSKIRYDYPICLADSAEDHPAIALKEIFDHLLEKLERQGDEGEMLTRDLLKMEALIKIFVEKHGKMRLSNAWERAAKQLHKENHAPAADKTQRDKRLADALAKLEIDGWLMPYGTETVLQLFQSAGQNIWQKKSQSVKTEVEQLVITLSEILDADNQLSRQAQNSDRLQAAMGKSDAPEMDFGKLSALIAESHLREALSPQRRQRIETVLKSLTSLQNEFFSAATNAPGASDSVAQNCGDALAIFQSKRRHWLDLCKNMRIARLDLANKYLPEKHDGIFENFTEDFLSAEEKSLFPPVFLTLSATELSSEDKAKLVEILASDWKIKILFHIENLSGNDGASSEKVNAWAMNAAKMALNLNSAFVMQTPAANVPQLIASVEEGSRFSGPALFSIFMPEDNAKIALPGYLISAAASDARVFPAFTFDPEGENLRERFSLKNTLQLERLWPETDLEYESADGEKVNEALAFTAADFLAASQNPTADFLPIPRKYWGEILLPLKEFLPLQSEDTEHLPYLKMVDSDGLLWRVIPSARVVDFANKIANNYRFLQELGGINNSHANYLLAREKEQLAAAAQKEIDDLRKAHEAEMSQTVDELSREIVSRIAAGLLREGTNMPAAYPARATSQPVVATPEIITETAPEIAESPTPAAEPEEDEDLSFDEPYIDTPLCTSCNECTDKNSLMFAYDENKQAFIKDATAGTFRELVEAAEKCPAHIIHPGKPKNPDEPGLDELIKRAEKFN